MFVDTVKPELTLISPQAIRWDIPPSYLIHVKILFNVNIL